MAFHIQQCKEVRLESKVSNKLLLLSLSSIAQLKFLSLSASFFTSLPVLPKNTQYSPQSNPQASVAYQLWDYFVPFSNLTKQTGRVQFLLILRKLFCYFLLITQQIFRTKSHLLILLVLLQILRNCDILSLSDEVLTIP